MPDGVWPVTVPAVAQLLRDGLELPAGVTFLVGENGSGKSTIVEAVAMAYGLNPEGGTAYARHRSYESESGLNRAIMLQRGVGAGHWGHFLRAETMHGLYTYLEDIREGERQPRHHEMSHGESFLTVLDRNFDAPGLYCLDEPEAALSFSSCLTLIGVLHDLVSGGGQVLCATHSPLIAAMPGATILELGEWGMREVEWSALELVDHWRRYLTQPEQYLRHVISPP